MAHRDTNESNFFLITPETELGYMDVSRSLWSNRAVVGNFPISQCRPRKTGCMGLLRSNGSRIQPAGLDEES